MELLQSCTKPSRWSGILPEFKWSPSETAELCYLPIFSDERHIKNLMTKEIQLIPVSLDNITSLRIEKIQSRLFSKIESHPGYYILLVTAILSSAN